MRGAFVIAAKDVRLRIRDRSAIVIAFIAPLAIAALMSFAFRGADSFHMTIAVADGDHGPVAAAMMSALDGPDLRSIVTVHRVADEDAARQAVNDRDVAAAIVFPSGFSTAAASSVAASLPVYTSTNNELAGSITQAIASSFVAQVNADRLSVATAQAAATRAHAPPPDPSELTARVSKLSIPEQVVSKPIGAKPLKAVSYYAPAMAIFSLFFLMGFTARSFIQEQADGTLDRLAVAPIRPAEIILGKVLSVVLFGLGSMATLIVVTSLAFGADWGDPVAAALITLVMVLAIGALSALLITLAHTERQASGYAAILTFGLALLGGNFISIAQAGPLLRKLALLTPNGWALRGFVDQATGASGVSHALQPVVAILLITAVIAIVAAVRSRDLVIR